MGIADGSLRGENHIAPLDEAAITTIHERTMEVIETIGIQLQHEGAREILAAEGASIGADDVVTIPREVVEAHIERAPPEFVLHGRDPDKSVVVGGDGPPVRAPGYGPDAIRTAGSGRRESQLSDYERLLKLAQSLDAITCVGYALCDPGDVPESVKHYHLLERTLALTDKPIMGPTYGVDRAQACLEMVGIAVEDRTLSKPYVAGLINTVPPRRIGAEMLGGLLTYARAGQPVVISSFTKAGASGPPTLAGSLVLTNAENLVGITLAQAVNPGTPVVYGVPTATVDRRYGTLSIGNPESALFASIAGQLGRYYGIPSRGGGGLTDATEVDYYSGFESSFLQAMTAFSEVDFVLHAAGILESYASISPEKFVLDCEVLRYLDRFARGVDLNPEQFDVDALAAVEPGGHFLDDSLTTEPADETFYRAETVDKRSFDTWGEASGQSVVDMAASRVDTLLDRYQEPSLAAGPEQALSAYLSRNTPSE